MASLGEVLPLLWEATEPLLHVFLAASVGAALAAAGILDAKMRQNLAKLSVVLFIPCLTFVKLADAVTAQNLLKWWYIPVNVLLNNVIGGFVGVLAARMCRIRHPHLFRIVICCVTSGNVGNLPMVLLVAVCNADKERNLFGSQCEHQGITYVLLGMWAAQTMQFTVVNRVLAYQPVKETHEPLPIGGPQPSCVGVPETETVVERRGAVDLQEVGADFDGCSSQSVGSVQSVPRHRRAAQLSKAFLRRFADWVQPPVLASWAAVAVGTSPPLKRLIFGDAAPLGLVRDVLGHFGAPFLAAAMLVLGGNLMTGPGVDTDLRVGKMTIVAVIVGRLLIVPVLGFALVSLLSSYDVLPPDPMFKFVCVLQHGTPTAIAVSTLVTLHGKGVGAVSTILFWEYLLALPFMVVTLFLAFFAAA
eukprot:TRINITY_DN10235_c0_g1_i1.p1 TRINITY_DN10235_c0_g1~~TRINITY_DN10235_c0_g1_i1.p1  ORF type:complete len:417 (-),score=34.21 TRINITY_DN10235_c0_g1_i1:279-1529(-)